MGNEQKITEVWDIAALEAQKAKVIDMMKQTVSEMEKTNSVKISFNGDSKTIGEATKITSEYNKQYEKTIQLTGQLNNLKSTEGQIEEKLQQAQKESIKNKKLEAQATNDQVGAYTKLSAEAALATKNARDMAAQYGTNSKEFKQASQTANELNTKLKEIDAEINIHSKNVGNYEGATMSLRQEIRKLTQTLAGMEMQGQNNSKEYKTMVMRLGELKDAVGDVQARSKFFADDARYLNTVTQAVQGLVGAYSVYVGVTELVGEKNEELEKIMRKMMALMTVMQGLQQVANMLNKDSYVRVAAQLIQTKLKVYWTGIQTAATESGTIAQKAFNIAVKANPIGLLVTAIIAAAAAMYAYGKKVSDVTKIENSWIDTNKEVGKTYSDQKQSIETLLSIAKNTNKSDEQRLLALKKLNEETKGVVTVTDLSTGSLKNLDIQTKTYLTTLMKQIKLEAARQKLIELEKSNFDLQAENMKTANEITSKNIVQLTSAMSFSGPGFALYLTKNLYRLKEFSSTTEMYSKLFIEYKNKENNEQIKLNETLIKGIETYINENTVLENNTATKDKNTKATIKYAEGIERVQKILPKQVDATVTYYEKLQELNKQLQTGLITQKEYNKAYYELNGVYIDAIDNTEKLTKAQMDLNNEIRAAKSTELNKLYEEVPKLAGQGLELIQSYSDLMSINNDNELKEYQKLQDDKLRILNERLRLGLISEAQYTAEKSNLELDYDKKKEELEKKEFKRKKAIAIAEAIINAATGVIKALGEGSIMGILQAGLIGAMSALEIAKINAQYPTYAKGRDGGKAEMAIVGEHGFEYISTDTGLFKTPNHSTLTYLPSGASVIPHEKSKKIENYLKTPQIYSEKQKESKENKELLNELKKLNSKPNTNINIDKHGFAVMMAKGGSYVNFVNDHIRIKH